MGNYLKAMTEGKYQNKPFIVSLSASYVWPTYYPSQAPISYRFYDQTQGDKGVKLVVYYTKKGTY